VLAQVPLVPPIVELGKRLGWSPLPLTIKEARRYVRALQHSPAAGRAEQADGDAPTPLKEQGPIVEEVDPLHEETVPAVEIDNLRFSYNGHAVLHGIDLRVDRGEFVAIVGRNGAGKTTLLKQCMGLLKPDGGHVRVLGRDTAQTPVETLAQQVGYVPQNPNALLFADSVAEELAFTRRAQGLPASDDAALLRTVGLESMRERYPRDLSVGERQRVALAAVLVSDPDLILLDEPTRGLDYEQKAALVAFLQEQKRRNKTVVMVTHDVELVAQCAERVILLGDGAIAVDGPTSTVMTGSQVFSSQINKLFRDPRYLTVDDVMEGR
jgi:energy-coupling factor transporter ATP-binding protein EcfA2